MAAAAPVSPPPLPIRAAKSGTAEVGPARPLTLGEGLVEPRQQEAVPQPVAGDDGLALGEAPLAFEPELVAEEDEFAWPEEVSEAAESPAAAQAEPVAEVPVHEALDIALAQDEPLLIGPPRGARPPQHPFNR